MLDIAETARSFFNTQWRSRAGLKRELFDAWQQQAVQKWLQHEAPKVPFYATSSRQLRDLPIIDKSVVMQNFSAFNKHGVSADQVRKALEEDMRIGELTVGASTGTSGNRGFFVISRREKFRWLGTILAKTMPDMMFQKQRVAILLPQGGQLYESANKASRIDLRLFNLTDGPEHWRTRLEKFSPTLLVAPPKVLRHIAECGYDLRPKRIFAAAETLDPMDRPLVESYFATPLEQIYMATEGLLGVTCRHGTLHLAEDSVHFEFESISDGLVAPLITCFQRTTQIMARYRMNDLLRLSKLSCPCGSPLQAVEEVVGRMDDCFKFNSSKGLVLITPDVLRNTILDTNDRISDFRLCQIAADKVSLKLPLHFSTDEAANISSALYKLLNKRGVNPHIETECTTLSLDTSRKLRRVERLYTGEETS